MPKPRAFCPMIQSLEERVVLSFSFSNLVHSLFPFIKSDDSKSLKAVRRNLPPAEVTGVKPGMPHPLQVQQAAHASAVKAARVKTAAGVEVPTLAPRLNRPGLAHLTALRLARAAQRGG